jgi:hypothetical protein
MLAEVGGRARKNSASQVGEPRLIFYFHVNPSQTYNPPPQS